MTKFFHLKKMTGPRGKLDTVLSEVKSSIREVVWPPATSSFIINPDVNKRKGKKTKSGKGGVVLNGVVPIKNQFALQLSSRAGWDFEMPIPSEGKNTRTSVFDAWKMVPGLTKAFALEWETGNISSSHRSINRIILACIRGLACGGIVILPDGDLYELLTDRVGNYDELEMYFPVWEICPLNIELIVAAVGYDGTDTTVPYIPRGSDGNAFRAKTK